jgi:glycosyltransferase involved in cell wall biosynthesis
MACERPVIVAVDGQARKIVEQAEAGVFVEAENAKALAQAIVDLSENPDRRRQMGMNGRRYIVNNFSREKTARDYIGVLEMFITEPEDSEPVKEPVEDSERRRAKSA